MPKLTGDLGKLGYIPFDQTGLYEISCETDYVQDIYSFTDSTQYDLIVIIGDSFSQNFNKNGYVCYMADSLKKNISNCKFTFVSPEQLFLVLLKKMSFKENTVVVLESVEREVVSRLINLDNDFDDLSVCLSSLREHDVDKAPNSCQLYDIASWLRMQVNYENPISSCDLNAPKFSQKGYEDKLYVYKDDFVFLDYDEADCKKALDNLLWLKQKADSAGVHLIYVVAANKYDVYSDYIVDNRYPIDETMKVFSDLDTMWFVDTKSLLQPYVEQGVKDIYYVNDTHWSPIGSKIVGEFLADLIANFPKKK